MGQHAAVHLCVLGTRAVLNATGDGAARLEKALTSTWEWCLATGDRAPLAGDITIEAVLDSDPAVVEHAEERGAVAGSDLQVLMDRLTPAVTTAAITNRAGSLLMLHACAVADPVSGATVVLVGPSGMGKTTAARTLGRSLGYVTDETVAIDAAGRIVPFAKPLSVLQPGQADVKDQVAPSALGLLPPPGRCHVAAVLLLDRGPDTPASPAIETVPTLHALALLAPQVSFLGLLEKPLHRIAALLGATGGLRRVSYQEATQLSEVVSELLGTPR